MRLTAGINHVALLTRDLEAFLRLYTEVFGAEVIFDIEEDGLRHAAVGLGAGAGLHAFEMADSPDATASDAIFARGHLDHVALNVPDEEAFSEARRRLLARDLTDGTVTDFGALKSFTFRDPDGLEVEVALWGTEEVRRFDERVVTA